MQSMLMKVKVLIEEKEFSGIIRGLEEWNSEIRLNMLEKLLFFNLKF